MDKSELRKLIDSGRPEDLHLPEMQPLAERLESDGSVREQFAQSQQFDACIKRALDDVAVPYGLADRIVGKLQRSAPDDPETALAVPETCEETGAVSAALSGSASPDHTRWPALAVTLSGLAAAVTLLVLSLPQNPGALTDRELAGRVRTWTAAVSNQSWRTAEAPTRQFPLTRNVTLPVRRWQKVATGSSQENVVCYDLSSRGRGRVLLFVLQTDRAVELPPAPNARPRNTQGICVGLWQEQGVVFALAVEGNAQRYQEVIRPTPHIAAARRSRDRVAG